VLPNKEPHQFALVFDIKADGFFSLIKAAKGMPIGATVSFSSVAGRFGNNGQSDYSSANDLLCKISSSMRSWRPETRGIAIDWTAWGQIGMASRGSVQAIMEALGVDMLPPEAGVPTIRRELTYGATRGELVVAGRLGAWLDEKDPTGGLDVDKLNAQLAERKNPLLMVGQVKSFRLYGGIEVETTLDPKVQPFLFDHAPDAGTPWLPGVMATEALAQLASTTAPGYRVASVEHEQMMGAFKFFRMEPRTLYLSATVKPAANGDLLATATLRSVTKPAKEGLARAGEGALHRHSAPHHRAGGAADDGLHGADGGQPADHRGGDLQELLPRSGLPGDRAGGHQRQPVSGADGARPRPEHGTGAHGVDHGATAGGTLLPVRGAVDGAGQGSDGAAARLREGDGLSPAGRGGGAAALPASAPHPTTARASTPR
jgi:hypothetical protein